jgi:hypothetical protein
MKLASIRFSRKELGALLGLPDNVAIEAVVDLIEGHPDQVGLVLSGPDFPNHEEGEPIPDYQTIYSPEERMLSARLQPL